MSHAVTCSDVAEADGPISSLAGSQGRDDDDEANGGSIPSCFVELVTPLRLLSADMRRLLQSRFIWPFGTGAPSRLAKGVACCGVRCATSVWWVFVPTTLNVYLTIIPVRASKPSMN